MKVACDYGGATISADTKGDQMTLEQLVSLAKLSGVSVDETGNDDTADLWWDKEKGVLTIPNHRY